MEHANDSQYISVVEFYRGKSVFITGATGFLGKVLVEKLLYSCIGIGKVFILLRDKNGTSADVRLENMLNSPVFSRVRDEMPQNLQKIQVVRGDLTSFNMGLTTEQLILIKEVSVVFHLAAAVKFNEPLKDAVSVNVEGTREVMKVFKQFNNLQAFVYISTAFSNSNEAVIEEIVYPPPRSLNCVYEYINNNTKDDDNIRKILGGRPNTYTFAKALAENVVVEDCGQMPVAIVRPSIVTPSANEPFRGWIDNWLGITTFLYAIAKGWTRFLYGKKHNVIDIIPVDYVVNFCIIAAARCKRRKKVPVYNICTSSSNPIDYSLLEKLLLKESAACGFNDFPLLRIIYTTSSTLNRFLSLIFEILPAYLADFWIKVTRKQKGTFSYVKAQAKQSAITESMQFFPLRSWMIKSDRARVLFTSQSRQDQRLFACDPTEIVWAHYIPAYFHGIKTFLLNLRDF